MAVDHDSTSDPLGNDRLSRRYLNALASGDPRQILMDYDLDATLIEGAEVRKGRRAILEALQRRRDAFGPATERRMERLDPDRFRIHWRNGENGVTGVEEIRAKGG